MGKKEKNKPEGIWLSEIIWPSCPSILLPRDAWVYALGDPIPPQLEIKSKPNVRTKNNKYEATEMPIKCVKMK